jgi:hypothetical protein
MKIDKEKSSISIRKIVPFLGKQNQDKKVVLKDG